MKLSGVDKTLTTFAIKRNISLSENLEGLARHSVSCLRLAGNYLLKHFDRGCLTFVGCPSHKW